MGFLPLEFSLYMKSIIATVVTEWLHKRRGVEGISPNRRNSHAPLEERVRRRSFHEEQRRVKGSAELTVVREEMSVEGVPVGIDSSRDIYFRELSIEKLAERRAFRYSVYLSFSTYPTFFAQFRPLLHTKLLQVT